MIYLATGWTNARSSTPSNTRHQVGASTRPDKTGKATSLVGVRGPVDRLPDTTRFPSRSNIVSRIRLRSPAARSNCRTCYPRNCTSHYFCIALPANTSRQHPFNDSSLPLLRFPNNASWVQMILCLTCGQQWGGFGTKFGGTVSQSRQWGSRTSRPKSVGHSIVKHSVLPPSVHVQNEMHSSYHSAPTLYVLPMWLHEPLSVVLSEMFVLITSAGRKTCSAGPARAPSVTRT